MASTHPLGSHAAARIGRASSIGAVQRELIEERANALGRVGRRLEAALARWRSISRQQGVGEELLEEALDEVRDATYALLVQRDCIGFRMDNLAWIRRHYDIPDAALRRI